MADNLNSINSIEQNEHKGGLLERIRNSGKKVLAPVLAAGSISLGGLPAATIPATGAAVATVLTACSDDEPDNPNDTIAPTVNVSQHDVDITGGKQVRISGNQLYIGDVLVASWTDNVTKNCTVELSLNGKTISSGTTISEEGYLTVKVTDEAGNAKTIDIKLTINNQLISGLENLRNLEMKVDQEVNLLNGITFGNGASLVKVEIEMDGQTTQITDPNHYTPQYPGQCTIILTVKDKNGNIVTERVNKNIQALEYQEITFDNANIIEQYSRYNKLSQTSKNFIYPHILASYSLCNQIKPENTVCIIMGETANTGDIENIGQYTTPTDHAYEGYYRIRYLCPETPIKGCKDSRANLKNYINSHPNKTYIISCAADALISSDENQMSNNPDAIPLREILNNPNVIVVSAAGNQTSSLREIFNEQIKNKNNYNGSSYNTKNRRNNKITITGYHTNGYNNFFSPNYKQHSALQSYMPVGYEIENGNIVMALPALISSNGSESNGTSSSYPTAIGNGVITNATNLIKFTHPGITANDAMKIITEKYLTREMYQYLDESTNTKKDGGYRYFIDMEKLLNEELLQTSKIENLQFTAENIELPSTKGTCYLGEGIQFTINGQKYDATETNKSILIQAIKSGQNIKRSRNKENAKKHGNKVNLKTIYMNNNGEKIIQKEFTKDIE